MIFSQGAAAKAGGEFSWAEGAAGGGTIFVSDFKLEDSAFVSEEAVSAVLAPYRGRDLTMAELEEAVGKVTELYRQSGFPVARAYLPRQAIEGGVVTIRVLIGVYGSTEL